MKAPPEYVAAHGLLRGKSVLVTAAAGAGIGFAAAQRAAEEGCRSLVISDVHERRLNDAVAALREKTGLADIHGLLCCPATSEKTSTSVTRCVTRQRPDIFCRELLPAILCSAIINRQE